MLFVINIQELCISLTANQSTCATAIRIYEKNVNFLSKVNNRLNEDNGGTENIMFCYSGNPKFSFFSSYLTECPIIFIVLLAVVDDDDDDYLTKRRLPQRR